MGEESKKELTLSVSAPSGTSKEDHASRRTFIKNLAIAGAVIGTNALVAKKVASVVLEKDPQRAYLEDVLPGDRVMMAREYVVMTDEEKKRLVKTLIENYKKRLG